MTEKQITRASIATMLTFFLSGLSVASFLARIPTIRSELALEPSRMGLLLLIGSLGSLIALPSSGPVVGRWGPRVTIWGAYAVWATGITGVILAYEARAAGLLAPALAFAQIGIAMANATMNVEGGYVEVVAHRVRMPWYHAAYSVGTVVAALIGAACSYFHIGVAQHLAAVVVCVLLGIVWAGLNYVPQPIIEDLAGTSTRGNKRTSRAWREKRTLLIGVFVLGTGLMEGAANDWLPLAMVDGFHVSDTLGTATLALFLTVLTFTRFASSTLLHRWPVERLVPTLLLIAIGGLIVQAVAPWPALALVGVVAWAIGAALGFPSAASALSKEPAMAAARLSVLSTIGYGAFLAGPPLIGFLAEHLGYRGALGFIAIPVAVSVMLSAQLKDPQEEDPNEGTVGNKPH
ncbi:MFS transporter [Gleimia hominis]|uniref:MFS transporter n=1 Tax=Gleimia hominis TaxID=595468 RepID=UPI000C80C018|nr:MFS transporter [Gleimia hominis]WIK64559.1 MFS transporter [Gleimia hominis]